MSSPPNAHANLSANLAAGATAGVSPLVAASADPFPKQAESLPRARVLSYLVTISTPTRARKVAAGSALCIALASWAIILLVTGGTIWQVYDEASMMHWRPGSPTLTEIENAIKYLGHTHFYGYADSPIALWYLMIQVGVIGRIFLVAMLLFPALGLLLLTRAIFHGRPKPCRMAVALIVPFALVLLPFIVVPPCIGVVYGIGRNPQPAALLWLLILPPGAAILLLLKDVAAYLLWIARNPMVEKPPIPFVPATTKKGEPA